MTKQLLSHCTLTHIWLHATNSDCTTATNSAYMVCLKVRCLGWKLHSCLVGKKKVVADSVVSLGLVSSGPGGQYITTPLLISSCAVNRANSRVVGAVMYHCPMDTTGQILLPLSQLAKICQRALPTPSWAEERRTNPVLSTWLHLLGNTLVCSSSLDLETACLVLAGFF